MTTQSATTAKPWLAHYDQGVPAQLTYPATPLYFFLEETARKYPERPATIFKPHPKFGGSVLSYRALNALVDQLAAGLARLGVKQGERVVLFMPNMPQFVIGYYAILKLGAVVVATNPQYTAREIEHQLKDSGAETVIVMSRFYNVTCEALANVPGVKRVIVTNIKEYMPGLLRILFSLTKEKKDGHAVTLKPGHLWFQDVLQSGQGAPRPPVTVKPDDTALFQYSGGTTGVPKAAVALHRNLVANTLQIRSWLTDIHEGREIVLMAIPLFHVYGMVAGMSFGIQAGASLVLIPDPRDFPNLLAAINQYHPTVFPGVPRIYNAINNHPQVAQYDLKSIRACISGSAPLLIEIKTRFEQLTGGKLVEGFGLSEAPTATHCNPLMGTNKPGSIGMPFPDVECQIVDLETGAPLAQGEVGELLIKGPQVMAGYWNMPSETAGCLKDGWLYTGDIARMDEDGYFYIVDRKKELIKAGGFQVWPRDIEEVLMQHPAVLEAAVAGVPDAARGGETVKAWVVLKEGQSATEKDLQAFCAESLAPYKRPRSIEFRAELPKTTVGKILRRVLVQEEKEKGKK